MKAKQFFLSLFAGLLVAAGLLTMQVQPVLASSHIVLDSIFSDWSGRAHITDPAGDATNSKTDIVDFYFGTNPNDETLYFMAERADTGGTAIMYSLRIDTNDNGNFTEASDRILFIDFDPTNDASNVSLELYTGAGVFIKNVASNMDWGESKKEGGKLVEWGVSFADIGIVAFQPISIRLESYLGNNVSDQTANVQWSPANILGPVLLTAGLIAAGVWMAYRRKKLA